MVSNNTSSELKNCATDNSDEVGEESLAQEPGESLSSKCDVVNDESYLDVNDVDQPDSTDPTE